jgi:hypothetical protein
MWITIPAGHGHAVEGQSPVEHRQVHLDDEPAPVRVGFPATYSAIAVADRHAPARPRNW